MTIDPDDESSAPSLEDRMAELKPELDAMRARLVPEIGYVHAPDAKVLWKVLVLYQCLTRRTLELSDGIARAWSTQELLTSVLLARALTETAAFTWDVTTALRRHVQDANLEAVDKLIMDRMFATRMSDWIKAGSPPALNILTQIDKLDRDMSGHSERTPTEREQVVRPHYDLLSDFVHPNYLGVNALFGDLDTDARTFRFGGPGAQERIRLGRTLGTSMSAVLIVEGCLRSVDGLAVSLRRLDGSQ
jgi:hypothetical protein